MKTIVPDVGVTPNFLPDREGSLEEREHSSATALGVKLRCNVTLMSTTGRCSIGLPSNSRHLNEH
jgi:hypothetical protein